MYLFKVNKSGAGGGITRKITHNAIKNSHRRITMGGAINADKVYEDNTLRKATDNLRNLRISKPRIAKKYISFE
jgi:hypothetical protein